MPVVFEPMPLGSPGRKWEHGIEPVPKVHPIVDEILAETYGVMVYQEQVMRILNRVGGIELSSAYGCIKAISKKKLKAIAKALNDRPALKLDVAGRVDPSVDRDGLKHAALERQIRLLKFNELAKRDEAPASVDTVEVPAAEYEALLTRVYKDGKFDKPRNAIGLTKDLPKAEMETLLLANTSISDEDLRLLGERRAQKVHANLVDVQHVPGERVFMDAPRLDVEGLKDKGKTTRVDFALH